MNPEKVFQRYVSQRTTVTPPGYKRDSVEGIVRYTPTNPGLEGLVMFSTLSEETFDGVVEEQIKHFEKTGFEWKIYDFDTPADIASRLERKGFKRGENEAFMLYPTSEHREGRPRSVVRIERISTDEGIRDVVAIQEKIWDRQFSWLGRSLRDSLNQSAIFCAYQDNEPIGSGWMEFSQQGDFAELHGGAVLPSLRGHGIYTQLFDVRVAEAKSRDIKFLAVDAAPMSRPILLKKGFHYICETLPYKWEANKSAQAIP